MSSNSSLSWATWRSRQPVGTKAGTSFVRGGSRTSLGRNSSTDKRTQSSYGEKIECYRTLIDILRKKVRSMTKERCRLVACEQDSRMLLGKTTAQLRHMADIVL